MFDRTLNTQYHNTYILDNRLHRLNNNIININKPMEFEAFADRALLFVANLVCYFVPHLFYTLFQSFVFCYTV